MSTAITAPSSSVHGIPTPRDIDWGRTVMVPLSVLLGGQALIRLVVLVRGETDGALRVGVALLTGALTAAFYLFIVRAYLRRGAPKATTRVPLALAAGPLATFLPFGLPFVATGGSRTVTLLLGELLLIAGFAYSVWAVRCLDRSLSLVAQARALVDHGPYATVRHPLYLGELVAMLGLALTLGGTAPLALWSVLVLLQAYRAVQEERLLTATLPDYADYQTRTARIVPGLF